MTEPVPRTEPPRRTFVDGPAAGHHVVFPDIDGDFPTHVVMTAPYDRSPWTVDALQPTEPHPEWHIYTRDLDPDCYRLRQSRAAGKPRITCPRCGRTSADLNDVSNGYCPSCHQWTRNPLLAVLYDGPANLPRGWPGRWVHRETTTLLPAAIDPGSSWTLTPTGLYEQNSRGGYAEVFLAGPADAS